MTAVGNEPCPRCGAVMVDRLNPVDATEIWGCSRYPDCAGTRPKAAVGLPQDWDAFVRQVPGATARGGETFLTIDGALTALDWVEQHDATLLGIEGFRLTPDATRPSLDHIADFSTAAGSADSVTTLATARQLLEDWRDEITAVVLVVDVHTMHDRREAELPASGGIVAQ